MCVKCENYPNCGTFKEENDRDEDFQFDLDDDNSFNGATWGEDHRAGEPARMMDDSSK
jgi:hypothetical protein